MTAPISLDDLKSVVTPFADLGTPSPEIISSGEGALLIFVRDGQETSIRVLGSKIVERYGQESANHVSVQSLLASERFANLRDWALKQELMLRQEFGDLSDYLSVHGLLDGDITELTVSEFDARLTDPQLPDTTKVVLIDGPAGIGKTQFINRLALERASNFVTERRPLILHVESRGRQLSYVYDLVAFSLQRLRSSVTFDQIPILAKYGLVTIAIDGFDELADPNGYNLAWAQVNELVENIRGRGQLILAGRETFIGRERVQSDIKALRAGIDSVHAFTLQPPSPGMAMQWLAGKTGISHLPEELAQFFERGSLALRPFFLAQLANMETSEGLADHTEGGVLTLLSESMLDRESRKFTAGIGSREQIESISRVDLHRYVSTFMVEVARDMADNQTSSISEANLLFIAKLSLPGDIDEATEFTLVNRASYVGFLTNDSRPGHFRFYHEKFFEYFLSQAIFEAIVGGEMAKFLRQNIFGTSFLETFAGVAQVAYLRLQSPPYFENLTHLIKSARSLDRGRKNLSSIGLASLSFYEGDALHFEDLEMDEVRIVGVAGKCQLERCLVSQLDVRGADVSLVMLRDTSLITLIASNDTLFPASGFEPQRLVVVDAGADRTSHSSSEISQWISENSTTPARTGFRPTPKPAQKSSRDYVAAKGHQDETALASVSG